MTDYKDLGESIWKESDKINGELLVMSYGVFVSFLVKKEKDNKKVNNILFDIGTNIGTRLIEEFFCKTELEIERSTEKIAEIIAKVGFKMFLNIIPEIEVKENSFDIILTDDPLTRFVCLKDFNFEKDERLIYCNVYCGVIASALKSVCINAECFIPETKGDSRTVISVKLKKELLRD